MDEIETLELIKKILKGEYQDKPNEYEMEITALKGIDKILSDKKRGKEK